MKAFILKALSLLCGCIESAATLFLDKYLKTHKNDNIDYAHFEKIIKILLKALKSKTR